MVLLVNTDSVIPSRYLLVVHIFWIISVFATRLDGQSDVSHPTLGQ